jgi:hypothetical protein
MCDRLKNKCLVTLHVFVGPSANHIDVSELCSNMLSIIHRRCFFFKFVVLKLWQILPEFWQIFSSLHYKNKEPKLYIPFSCKVLNFPKDI